MAKLKMSVDRLFCVIDKRPLSLSREISKTKESKARCDGNLSAKHPLLSDFTVILQIHSTTYVFPIEVYF